MNIDGSKIWDITSARWWRHITVQGTDRPPALHGKRGVWDQTRCWLAMKPRHSIVVADGQKIRLTRFLKETAIAGGVKRDLMFDEIVVVPNSCDPRCVNPSHTQISSRELEGIKQQWDNMDQRAKARAAKRYGLPFEPAGTTTITDDSVVYNDPEDWEVAGQSFVAGEMKRKLVKRLQELGVEEIDSWGTFWNGVPPYMLKDAPEYSNVGGLARGSEAWRRWFEAELADGKVPEA
jgi:hypothetical protein